MPKFAPTEEDNKLYEEARKADDPFRGSKFGPVGQYRNCDMCGGRFESRGLKVCPDCYEIRKKEPGFDDDKSWFSKAEKPAFEHRLCQWCGAQIDRFRGTRKVPSNVQFCSTSHRKAHNRATPEQRENMARRVKEMR